MSAESGREEQRKPGRRGERHHDGVDDLERIAPCGGALRRARDPGLETVR
jgi:hypothetical protein